MRIRAVSLLACLLLAAGCGQAAATPQGSSPGLASDHAASAGPSPDSTAAATYGTTDSTASGISVAELKAATKRFLAGYDDKDAQAVCSQYTPQALTWFPRFSGQVFQRQATCQQMTTIPFHRQYNEDSGDPLGPVFQHVSVVNWLDTYRYDDYAGISTIVQAKFPGESLHSPSSNPALLTFWFQNTAAGLRLANVPLIDPVLEGSPTEPTANLAPITPQAVNAPATIAAPSFSCTGPSHSSPDATGDTFAGEANPYKPVTKPWLDILAVTSYDLDGFHPCITITFAAPPRPDTKVRISGKYLAADLVIGSGANFAATFGFAPHLPPSQVFGERGSTLYLALDPGEFKGLPTDQLAVCDVQDQAWNPADLNLTQTFDTWQHDRPTTSDSEPCLQ